MPKASPTLIIFAGANGSGKTTAAKLLLPKLKIKEFVNADEIARGLSPFNPSEQHLAAGRIVLDRIQQLIQKSESFAIETTLSGKTLAANIKKAQKAGFEIQMHYMFCSDINVNIQRIKNRVVQGGHHVPAADVRRRYWRSLQNWLMPYKNICDNMTLYDTTSGELVVFASKESKDGFIVYDEPLSQRFVQRVIEARDDH